MSKDSGFPDKYERPFLLIFHILQLQLCQAQHTGCLKKNAMEIQQAVVHHRPGLVGC
jgi:hypothetical protein